ncbi:SERTA domain-containing protein 3 [Esox lucius]|uniref:SERTA domain-containing protein n=1 Tax=Esox lucius TaxID=8010 RepID=A0A6Q2Z251_ESOLU|nr:SERTA domain-containing protein 3 [Esox lucius]
MIAKGQKRKLHDDDFLGGMCSGTWESQCQSLLDISLNKYYRGQEQVDHSLRRSVLIANTLKQMQPENRPFHGSVNLAGPVPSMVPLKPFSNLDSGPGVVMNGPVSVDDLEHEWMSSESDFSLSATVGSILKDLDMTIDGGPQGTRRTPFRSIDNLPDVGRQQATSGYLSSEWRPEGCRTSEQVALGGVEVMHSSYVQDGTLGDLFQDIDTSVLEREMGTLGVRADSGVARDELLKYLPSLTSVPSTSPSVFFSQSSRDLIELEHIMEILVKS